MSRKKQTPIEWDSPEVMRIRKIRAKIAERHGTLDNLIAHWVKLDKKRLAKKKSAAESK